MRWLRWTAVGVLILAVGALALPQLVEPSKSCQDQASIPALTFVGAAVAKNGATVTFTVVADSPSPTRSSGAAQVRPGDRLAVRYVGGDQRFIHRGQRYLVNAYGSGPGRLASGVQTAQECDNDVPGVGTSHADGVRIDTSLFTRDGFAPYVTPVIVGLMLLIAVLAIGGTLYAKNRRPRLTVHGEPRDGLRPG